MPFKAFIFDITKSINIEDSSFLDCHIFQLSAYMYKGRIEKTQTKDSVSWLIPYGIFHHK